MVVGRDCCEQGHREDTKARRRRIWGLAFPGGVETTKNNKSMKTCEEFDTEYTEDTEGTETAMRNLKFEI